VLEEKFIVSLDKLFDIGTPNAYQTIELEEGKLFYKSMQEDRKASMASVDKKWVKTKTQKLKRLQGQSELKRRSDEDTRALFNKVSSENIAEATGSLEQPEKEQHVAGENNFAKYYCFF